MDRNGLCEKRSIRKRAGGTCVKYVHKVRLRDQCPCKLCETVCCYDIQKPRIAQPTAVEKGGRKYR